MTPHTRRAHALKVGAVPFFEVSRTKKFSSRLLTFLWGEGQGRKGHAPGGGRDAGGMPARARARAGLVSGGRAMRARTKKAGRENNEKYGGGRVPKKNCTRARPAGARRARQSHQRGAARARPRTRSHRDAAGCCCRRSRWSARWASGSPSRRGGGPACPRPGPACRRRRRPGGCRPWGRT